MVGLYYVIQEMGIFPMRVTKNFCDMPLPKYYDFKTVLIYRPHPVYGFFYTVLQYYSISKRQRTIISDEIYAYRT